MVISYITMRRRMSKVDQNDGEITKGEAGVLLGADGGPVHVIDVENQSEAVVEVFCYECHYFHSVFVFSN